MRTCAREASSRMAARFATLAVINACRRSQIASWRKPGAERGSDPPSKISSYGRLMGTSKAAIGAAGKRPFLFKTELVNRRARIGIVSALF